MKPPSDHPQQGAMFNVKPAASHQWPRGYTPDRLHETQAALGKISKVPWMSQQQAGVSRYELTGAVARSTAPLSPENFPRVTMSPSTSTPTSGSSSYVHSTGVSPRGRISADVDHGTWSQYALLHEIGHHTDFQTDPETYKAKSANERVPYDAPGGRRAVASPSLEGYAEGFATTHFRPDPRDKQPTNSDSFRGYDNVYGNNEDYRSNFARAGADPARIGARRPAPDLSPRASQGKLF